MPPKARIATVTTKTASIGIAFLVHGWAGPRPSGYQRLPQRPPHPPPQLLPHPPPHRPPPRTSLMINRSISAPMVALMIAEIRPEPRLRKQPAPDQGTYDADQ
jgi:hypothetical protein